MASTKNREYTAHYAVQDVRELDEVDVFCGIRKLAAQDSTNADFILSVDAEVESAIEFQTNLHRQSQNYDDSTTRVIAIVSNPTIPATVLRVTTGGALEFDRELDATLLLVEIAGPCADSAERNRFDNQILMYEPAKLRKRPWWKLW